MAKIAKRVQKSREGVDPTKLYGLTEAVTLVKERATAKFDETIEVAMNLGVDPRHADQMVRGVVICRTAPAGRFASPFSPVARRLTKPRLPAPTSSVRKSSSKSSRAARSTSIAALRPPT